MLARSFFGVGEQQENLSVGVQPIVDHARTAAFAFAFRRHAHLAHAATAGNHAAGVGMQHQQRLQRGQRVLIEQLSCAAPEERSFNEHH